MSHAPYEAAAVDETAPRPADFDAHLLACAACRALAEGHRAALALRGVTLPARRAVSRSAVALRLSAAFSVVLVAVTMATVQCRQDPMPTDGSLEALQALSAEHACDLTKEDETYAPFKQLPLWLAPQGDEP